MRIGKMEFNKRMHLRVNWSAACVAAGLALLIGSMAAGHLDDLGGSFLAGAGAGLLAAGVVLLVKTLHTLRDPEKQRVARIEEEDERNLLIDMRSSQWTLFVGILVLAVAAGVTAFFNRDMMHALSAVLLLLIAVKWISMVVLRRWG
ncbi:DUF2178 domain-containing protein [Ethanoligenens harbinense]|uniref:DUF2178 domain-containing protein n=1 Tax=Ethanoligenens harbinense (strain DSM 18485 / JCM 12961 / CGMCC 1.5033 / YUAN-3) TaxID=663278 RepID=E6U6N1_ETHHY|nr:DUF2178 domain-containing protein [Ethanoligenens harbinense]ADU25764.1 hypothetical protein Ethha_0177 [Ethanoligenens harbinense YUAN-3]AVQ94934.1 hypothetical protein CXQ68_00910 [Ethanoligenens harbinense YUAN-3]AYF37626.1 hypothetical protein CXP51_00915 [Ethanoligenens harbinense]AYF40346.1 hypothetical protein CN246_00910 [Ethanoligenens harbinense]QCN91182.1 hypothetical protein DRA42_00925 [Ethanoligenens harbinense]